VIDYAHWPRDRAALAALLPHGESMCLLEALEDAGSETIACRGRAPGDPGHPLARDGRLAPVHAVEYAAQAAAVHAALISGRDAAGPGMLASVRELCWSDDGLAGEPLRIECTAEIVDARLCRYGFRVRAGADGTVTGRLTIAFGELPA
jgi:predicted hotdog family 3-hydroxylacyl-ACP dehydratase